MRDSGCVSLQQRTVGGRVRDGAQHHQARAPDPEPRHRRAAELQGQRVGAVLFGLYGRTERVQELGGALGQQGRRPEGGGLTVVQRVGHIAEDCHRNRAKYT